MDNSQDSQSFMLENYSQSDNAKKPKRALAKLLEDLKTKEKELEAKNTELKLKDMHLQDTKQQLRQFEEKQHALQAKEEQLLEKEEQLQTKERQLQAKEQELGTRATELARGAEGEIEKGSTLKVGKLPNVNLAKAAEFKRQGTNLVRADLDARVAAFRVLGDQATELAQKQAGVLWAMDMIAFTTMLLHPQDAAKALPGIADNNRTRQRHQENAKDALLLLVGELGKIDRTKISDAGWRDLLLVQGNLTPVDLVEKLGGKRSAYLKYRRQERADKRKPKE